MSTVMTDNFTGAPGESFTGDAVYSFVVGTSVPKVASHYGVALRFSTNTIIAESFAAATGPRFLSRIYRLIGTQTQACNILSFRTAVDGPSYTVTINSGKLALSGNTNVVGAVALPKDVEFRVEYALNSAGTLLTATIFPNISSTTPLEVVSVATNAASVAKVREGLLTAGGLGVGASLDIAWPIDDNVAAPGLRKYVYLTTDKVGGIVPETVAVVVHDENLPAGSKTYTVDFGDGTTVGPQSSPNFAHTFTTPGDWPMTPKADVT